MIVYKLQKTKSVTKKDVYSLLLIEEFIDSLSDNGKFSMVDADSA